MNIIFAKFANAEESAVVLTTQESGQVLVSLAGEDNTSGWRAVYQAWPGGTSAYVEPPGPSAIDQAKVFVARHFDGLELLTMKDWRDSMAAEDTPKLQACYGWVQEVIAAAAAGETSFASPPNSFGEVLAEISAINQP